MRARTAWWVAGCAAAGSVALIGGGLALAYMDRHLVPASLADWTVSNVSGQVVNMAVPVTGFVLASRRPENRIGWLFLVAGLALGLSGFSNPYALHALVADRGSLPAGLVFAWLSNWIWIIAVVALAFMHDLKIPREKVNIHGGACALGHPIGASGARILVTLISALQQNDWQRGIATLCIGGGEATAIGIEMIK